MLYGFDLDGTLITSYMENPDKNYMTYTIIPGRVEVLNRLLESGHHVCIITNQAGVAFGYQTVEEVAKKLCDVLFYFFDRSKYAFSFELMAGCSICYSSERKKKYDATIKVYAALGHPESKIALWSTRCEIERRKPSPAMLYAAMNFYNTKDMIFVGDMDTDKMAADCAGVEFIAAEVFFAGEVTQDVVE